MKYSLFRNEKLCVCVCVQLIILMVISWCYTQNKSHQINKRSKTKKNGLQCETRRDETEIVSSATRLWDEVLRR